MERDFEREFRELKLSEVPDLWNRIEAGLSEKKIMAPVLAAPSLGNGTLSDKQYPSAEQEVNMRSWFRWNWARWGVAVACLCLVIMLPTLFKTLGIMDKSYSNDSTTSEADGMYSSSADNAGKAEIAETEDADIMYDDSMADASDSVEMEAEAGETNDAAAAENAGMADDVGAENAEADMADDNGAASTEADKEMAAATGDEMSDQATEEKKLLQLTEGLLLENVILQITETNVSGENMRYRAVVLQPDEDSILEDGMQIEIVCNDDTKYQFLRGVREEKSLEYEKNYKVTLCYEQDEWVVKVAEK